MSNENVINIEDSKDVEKREREKIRHREIINLVMRQTNYTEQQVEEKLVEWNNNYLNVIKEYINPDFYKKKPKIYKSKNQGMMTEIRGFMDTINKEYYMKKEAADRYKKFLKEHHFRQQMEKQQTQNQENVKINDISNN